MFRLDESSQVFLTESGTAFTRSRSINHCRLITTECRSHDPSSTALIAAQLCHPVAVADKVYAMKGRVAFSAGAVHLAEKSISAAAEAAKPSSSKDQSALSQGSGDDEGREEEDVSGEGWVWK